MSSRHSTTQRSLRGRVVRRKWCLASNHVRMNMYIAQAQSGSFKVVKNLGVIDPNEETVLRRDSAA
jgi:hypothetical protein